MKVGTLALIVKDGQILLGEKKGSPEIGANTINGPGGKQEPGESLEECLLREVKEEMDIGLDAAKLEKVAVITFHFGEEPKFQVHVYRTDSFLGEPKETEAMLPRWYPIDALPLGRMLESDHAWFPRAARGDKFTAKAYYRQDAAREFDRIEFFPFV